MTIEFVVAFPVMLIVAAIAVNACSFFGVCAAFDNDFRDAVRTCATSPAYGQDVAHIGNRETHTRLTGIN